MAHEHLRQYKNIFIVTATLAARSAIRGGMDVEEALSTSDLLIRNCEALQDVQSILRLQIDLLLTYTEQVARLRTGVRTTPLSLQVSAWVQKHLSDRIDTEAMAQEFHFSRPHLSHKFHQETGMTLTDFILTKKARRPPACSPIRIKACSPSAIFWAFPLRAILQGYSKSIWA